MIRRRWVGRLLFAVSFCVLGLLVLLANLPLRAVTYTVSLQGMTTPVRVAVLSDLHGEEFGSENARLLRIIRSQEVDAVFLVGDMLPADADAENVERMLILISALTDIAPVYFAPGNHELEYMETDVALLDKIAAAGAAVVNDSYVDVTIAGQPLRIGGTMGHAFAFGRTETEFVASPEYQFLKDFEQTDVPKICLAHMPDTFIFNGAYTLWNVDFVISGHTHGGLIRIPFAGGLYAPMQGFFPQYDRGLFQLGEHMQMMVTSGLAGHEWIPRINNPPEIAVIDIVPER